VVRRTKEDEEGLLLKEKGALSSYGCFVYFIVSNIVILFNWLCRNATAQIIKNVKFHLL
jgi:hypothetical protein